MFAARHIRFDGAEASEDSRRGDCYWPGNWGRRLRRGVCRCACLSARGARDRTPRELHRRSQHRARHLSPQVRPSVWEHPSSATGLRSRRPGTRARPVRARERPLLSVRDARPAGRRNVFGSTGQRWLLGVFLRPGRPTRKVAGAATERRTAAADRAGQAPRSDQSRRVQIARGLVARTRRSEHRGVSRLRIGCGVWVFLGVHRRGVRRRIRPWRASGNIVRQLAVADP
jgi:hypothetical protein